MKEIVQLLFFLVLKFSNEEKVIVIIDSSPAPTFRHHISTYHAWHMVCSFNRRSIIKCSPALLLGVQSMVANTGLVT